jgi:hypothetical protein
MGDGGQGACHVYFSLAPDQPTVPCRPFPKQHPDRDAVKPEKGIYSSTFDLERSINSPTNESLQSIYTSQTFTSHPTLTQ